MAETDWTNEELASLDRIPRYNPLDPANGGDAYSFGGDGYIDNQMRQANDVGIVGRAVRRLALFVGAQALLTKEDASNTKLDRIATGLSVLAAAGSETKAAAWADAPENTEVVPGKYSARHWAARAAAWAAGVSLPAISAANALQFLRVKADGTGYETAAVDLSSAMDMPRVGRTANAILTKADKGKWIDVTSGTFTQTFEAAATLGNGWKLIYANSGTGDITLDPNGSETIDGLTSFVMYPGEVRIIQSDGTALRSIVLSAFTKTYFQSGTFLRPPGYVGFAAVLIGGGGGGSQAGQTGSAAASSTGGFPGTAVGISFIPPDVLPSTCSVSIGAGGVGANSMNPAEGGRGGDTQFGPLTASGGVGGSARDIYASNFPSPKSLSSDAAAYQSGHGMAVRSAAMQPNFTDKAVGLFGFDGGQSNGANGTGIGAGGAARLYNGSAFKAGDGVSGMARIWGLS